MRIASDSPGCFALDHAQSCFRRVVARAETCAARRDNQIHIRTIGVLAQLVGERFQIIGENLFRDDARANSRQQFNEQLTGFVLTLAA